jgi:hypothetical protein
MVRSTPSVDAELLEEPDVLQVRVLQGLEVRREHRDAEQLEQSRHSCVVLPLSLSATISYTLRHAPCDSPSAKRASVSIRWPSPTARMKAVHCALV